MVFVTGNTGVERANLSGKDSLGQSCELSRAYRPAIAGELERHSNTRRDNVPGIQITEPFDCRAGFISRRIEGPGDPG